MSLLRWWGFISNISQDILVFPEFCRNQSWDCGEVQFLNLLSKAEILKVNNRASSHQPIDLVSHWVLIQWGYGRAQKTTWLKLDNFGLPPTADRPSDRFKVTSYALKGMLNNPNQVKSAILWLHWFIKSAMCTGTPPHSPQGYAKNPDICFNTPLK